MQTVAICMLFFVARSLGDEAHQGGLALIQRHALAIHKPVGLLRYADVPDVAPDLSFINSTVENLTAMMDLVNTTAWNVCTQFAATTEVVAASLEQAQTAAGASTMIPGSDKIIQAVSDIAEVYNASMASANEVLTGMCRNVSDVLTELSVKLQENSDNVYASLQAAAEEVEALTGDENEDTVEESGEGHEQFLEKHDAKSKLEAWRSANKTVRADILLQLRSSRYGAAQGGQSALDSTLSKKGGGSAPEQAENLCSQAEVAAPAVYTANETVADLLDSVSEINDTVTAKLQLVVDLATATSESINGSTTDVLTAHPELPAVVVSSLTGAIQNLLAIGPSFAIVALKMLEQADNITGDSLEAVEASYDVADELMDEIHDICDNLK